MVRDHLRGGLESDPTPRAPESSHRDRPGAPTPSPFLAHVLPHACAEVMVSRGHANQGWNRSQ